MRPDPDFEDLVEEYSLSPQMERVDQIAAESQRLHSKMDTALTRLEAEVKRLLDDAERLHAERNAARAENLVLRARISTLEHELQTARTTAAMRDAYGL